MMEAFDNAVSRKLVYKPKTPYGFDATIIDDDDASKPDGLTLVAPPNIPRPLFDFKTQTWSSAPESAEPNKALTLAEQVAMLAYQQMTAQQTITDLQKQNAQMAYKLMTAQGGTTA